MPRHPSISQAAGDMPSSIFARLVERLAGHKGDVHPFHLGDTHLTPPVSVEGLDYAGIGSLYTYAPPAGEGFLIDAVARKLARKNRLPVEPAGIQITAGATHALACAMRLVCDPGDEVLLLAPYWPLIRGCALAVGARPIEVPFTSELYEGADPAALLAGRVTKRTAAIYVTTPNNPDGKVLDARALQAVAEVAVAADLWVLSDEVYEDYLFDGRAHLSIGALPGLAERTLSAYSFSKSHGLAGLRVGYIAGPVDAITVLRRLANHSIYNVPRAMQHAARAALDGGEHYLARASIAYAEARDLTVATLARLGARCHVPDGGSYVFLDLARFERPGRMPALEALAAGGVLLAPGDAFGPSYASWARLCYTAVPRGRLVAGLATLEAILGRLL